MKWLLRLQYVWRYPSNININFCIFQVRQTAVKDVDDALIWHWCLLRNCLIAGLCHFPAQPELTFKHFLDQCEGNVCVVGGWGIFFRWRGVLKGLGCGVFNWMRGCLLGAENPLYAFSMLVANVIRIHWNLSNLSSACALPCRVTNFRQDYWRFWLYYRWRIDF